ncbi:hypothetical protein [Mesorhizobium silamurunense]|uniref:hypothetical protein n=1 Tax=Mesorhizobium silamurunense TaxID=499528 RepID=UPI00177C2128|nr:hypothetical protein [Mesorhizobium silamurunense]
MKSIIFLAVEAEAVDRIELGKSPVVADLLHFLEKERGIDVAELLIFKEDGDEPLEHNHPLHGHENPIFHANRCRQVHVSVHYGPNTFERHFAPSSTIAKITRWAIERAGLGREEAEEHVLQLHGTATQPPLSTHLGSLTSKNCAVVFDLVRKKLVQG